MYTGHVCVQVQSHFILRKIGEFKSVSRVRFANFIDVETTIIKGKRTFKNIGNELYFFQALN